MKAQPKAGTKVRFTRKFLRSTGQIAGSDANGRWIVQSCDCGLCRNGGFVATDQAGIYGDQRHIAIANIEVA